MVVSRAFAGEEYDVSACHMEDCTKEPWLAVSLSWLLPGLGQLYAGSWARAFSFFCLNGALYVFWLVSLISASVSPIWLPLVWACGAVVLPVIACVGAYKDARRRNTEEFEHKRRLPKDPWLTVFLSLLLPGAGHAYIRKPAFFLLYLPAFLGVYALTNVNSYALILETALYVLIYVHAYAASQIYRRTETGKAVFLLLFVIMLRSFDTVVLPAAYGRFLFTMPPTLGLSMSSTLEEGDQVIVNKFVYLVSSPKAGDIVGFALPHSVSCDSQSSETRAMKRIVAIGGQTVHIKNGSIFVNGEKWNFRVHMSPHTPSEGDISVDHFGEEDNDYLMYGVREPYRVPEGHYFLLGDNLPFSVDSRCFGAVPERSIVGRAVKIWWPPRRIGSLQ